MNRRAWALLLMLLPVMAVRADALSDAYSAGSSTGKGATSGANAIKNTSPADMIPGYSGSPPQTGYYGGVQGGGGSMAGDGQAALNNSEAGQATQDAMIKNPKTTIDPNADFITNGKNAESTSDTVANGTYAQCTDKVVSKTTFQNFTCDQDVNVIQACARTAVASGHESITYEDHEITLDSNSLSFSLNGGDFAATYTLPAGTVISVTSDFTFHPDNVKPSALDGAYYLTANTVFGAFDLHSTGQYNQSGNYQLQSGQVFNDPTVVRFTITDLKGKTAKPAIWSSKNLAYHFVMNIHIRQETKTWVPEVTWSESCAFDKGTATASAGSTCTDPGGDRQQVVNGQTYTVHSDCWQYTDNYVTPTNSVGNCGTLQSNANCTKVGSGCTESDSGTCTHQQVTYQCQKTITSTGKMCGGDYFCITGDCASIDPDNSNGFDLAISKLAGLAAAGDSVRADQVNVRAFTGQPESCRKAMAGFSDCCVDSGWGNSASLAHCSSDEVALAQAKAKKLVVNVGQTCARAVLGVCIQKKAVYCEFSSKLARIIQQQGRLGQLGIGFGSGDSPDCRGITVPELSSINFDKIDFSDFFEDFEKNKNIPNQGVLSDRIKQQIQAQVPQNSGANQ